MSERWKPESGELYYFISTAGDIIPERFYNYEAGSRSRFLHGNVFKTKAEAEAAAEKVKALLLSLHSELVTDCNQLPKLTAEVFDRPDCPAEATFAIVYQNGSAAFMRGNCYDIRPVGKGWEYSRSSGVYQLCEIPGNWDASDWQNSLVERPAKNLPDWCKVGEWVYLCNGTYSRIVSINDCHVNLENGISVGKNSIHEEMVSARLRPYNAGEMKALVGKAIERHSSAYLVISYAHDDLETTVYIEGKYLSADNLLRDFTINGKPCGCLEHLEAGKWVK